MGNLRPIHCEFEPIDDPKFHIPDADVSLIKRKYLDIPYANTSSAQKLDIFLLNSGDGSFPVILQIHGELSRLVINTTYI
jgi:hypothetical protein